ncbi:alpha/beta hydrolase [Sphingobium sp. SCG-1]|uniref:alpha/beta fold hydrolase n=1 Tax=Sphingobium sp. SCG-1 TaxID=2072936 RepID=UPI000CD67D32|nr:alpha/beta hydrolase [Sphingobium sp. SCG-1]AUW56708.1 alpha/beta hydrolase [Sphingobium sp. SCG-1]AUW59957.1 alpha/beta hydrolase [Sphingobium sp. SCG-1]
MTETPFFDRRACLAAGLTALTLSGMPAMAAPFASRRISVTVRGNGPDVLLIPGLASGPGIWNGTVAAVPGYRYHLVQVRGFAGLAPDLNRSGPLLEPLVGEIAAYITQAKIARPAVVGHSMGGTLAMLLAMRPAPAIRKVMVVDMLPDGASMVGGTASGMGYLADQLSSYFTSTKAGRQLFMQMIAQQPGAKGSDPDVIASALRELAHTDLGPKLPLIRAPMEVVYALGGDAATQRAQVQRYRTAYAAAKAMKLVPISPSGHMVMSDQPAKFAAALRNFLTG